MIPTKLLLAVFALITTTLGEGFTCDGEYSPNGKWCYKLIGAVNNFFEADKICKSSGGNVASIHSEEENAFVASFGVEVFIGLEYNFDVKNFTWTDGTLFDFSMWDESYPMNPEFFGNCVKMLKSGKWVDFECKWKAEYVCKKAATNLQCPVKPNNQFFVNGKITSPGYPGNYMTGLSCTYELMVPNDRSVKIEISEMMLGAGDTIEIFSRLAADNAYRIAVLSGNLTGESMTYTTPVGENKMLVKFTSKSTNGGYWRLAFQAGGCIGSWINGAEYGFNYCYKLKSGYANFTDAKRICEREEAQLISVRNAFHNEFILGKISKHEEFIWLGLVYDNNEYWRWTDGSDTQYTNWDVMRGEPQLSEGTCAVMMQNGYWRTVDRTDRAAYTVCYKP